MTTTAAVHGQISARHKPVIGVGPRSEMRGNGNGRSVFVQEELVRAIRAVGGNAIVLSYTDEVDVPQLMDLCDGLVLPGGFDVDPAHYGEDVLIHPEWVNPKQDAFDAALAHAAFLSDKPLLSICRGTQLVNVALGGDLWQDIQIQLRGAQRSAADDPRAQGIDATSDISHVADLKTFGSVRHDALVRTDSLLGRLFGAGTHDASADQETLTVEVNSSHHQALRSVATCLKVVATAPDGIIEAVESANSTMRYIGVQWHPESLWEELPEQLELFRWLVEQAAAGPAHS